MKKLSILISALLTLAAIISCTSESSVNNEKINEVALIPDVEWINRDGSREPVGIDSIEIVISSSSMGSNMVKKFPYINAEGKKEGTISGIPTGIVISVTLTALDSNNNVIYSGTVESSTSDPVGTSMDVEIKATQVSPFSPTSLSADAKSYKSISLVWVDNSENESGFIIERRKEDDPNGWKVIDSTNINQNSFTDSTLEHSTVYIYRVASYLSTSGKSEYYTNSDSARTLLKDTIAPVIKITSHSNPAVVNERKITIAGIVKDTSGILEMHVGSVYFVPQSDAWQVTNFSLPLDTNRIIIRAIDSSSFKNEEIETLVVIYDELFIDTVNDKPYFTIGSAELDTTIKVGSLYERVLKANDPDDNDQISFTADNRLTLINDTIRWTPSITDTGETTLWAKVEDQEGLSDSISWKITVNDTTTPIINVAPVFETKASDLPTIANVGQKYSTIVKASDANPNDKITYTVSDGPVNINGSTGEINWTPDSSYAGKDVTVTITATDDSSKTDQLGWTISVNEIVIENSTPKFAKSSAQMLSEIAIVSIYNDSVFAIDDDSDAMLTYSKLQGPATFTINESTGKISWQAAKLGNETISIKVSDQHGASDTLTWTVNVFNTDPVFTNDSTVINGQVLNIGIEYNLKLTAIDEDGHGLTYNLLEPTYNNAVINGNILTWTTAEQDVPLVNFKVVASDNYGGSDTLTWKVGVKNIPPVFLLDTIFVNAQQASTVSIPIHVPGRDLTNATNAVLLTNFKDNNFQNYKQFTIAEEYDTFDLALPNPTDSVMLIKSVILNQYGSDTTGILVIKVLEFVDVLGIYDSTAWSLYDGNIGSTIQGTTGGLIQFSTAYQKNIMILDVNKVADSDPANSPFPYAGISFTKDGDYSNMSQIDIGYTSDIHFYIKLIQSDIDAGSSYEYLAVAESLGKSLSLPINENAFSQPAWVKGTEYEKPFDPLKLIRIDIHFIDIQGQQLKDEVTINDFKLHGFVPSPK